MAVARSSFLKLYNSRLAYLEEIIIDAYDEHEEQFSQYANMRTTTRMKEEDLGVADYGLFEVKDEGDDIAMDDLMQSYNQTFTVATYAKATEITKETLADDQDNIMGEDAGRLAFAARQTIEQVTANKLLNDGFTTENSWDGVAIFGSHTLTGGGTYNNSAAADLDVPGLEAALQYFNDLVDERGKKISLRPMLLIVGTSLEWQARQLLNSGLLPGTNQNDINPIQSRNLTLMVSNYLTSSTSWFVMADPRVSKYKFYWRQQPELDSEVDFLSKSGLTSMDFRIAVGVSDPRAGYGSTGV